MRSSRSEERPPEGAPPGPTGNGRLWRFLVPRRRHYIVNWRYQIRASLLGVLLTLTMLLLVNLNVYFTNRASTESILVVNPGMRASLAARDRRQVAELALGSVVVTLAIFALGIFQSHKTAGAAFSLRRTLLQLRDGHYDAAPRLRRDDNLQELLDPVRDLGRALREITASDVTILQSVADSLGSASADSTGREAAARLREIIEGKRIRLSRPAPDHRPQRG